MTTYKFNIAEHTCRDFYSLNELVNAMVRNYKTWSWGARGWTSIAGKALRFRVSGHHHKGYVFVTVNGLDLFDIYLTNLKWEIKETIADVYLEDLIDTIDQRVEYVPQYGNR